MIQMEIHVRPFCMIGSERKILKGMDQYLGFGEVGSGICGEIPSGEIGVKIDLIHRLRWIMF